MRILVVGATGTIGRAVVAALSASNEIIPASLRTTTIKVDISDPASIQQMYRSLGKLDAVVRAAGQAKFAPLAQLSDADFRFCLENKLMGQVNLVRFGFEHMEDSGSFTLTTGILAQTPMPGQCGHQSRECRPRGVHQSGRAGSAAQDTRQRRQPTMGNGNATGA